MVWEWMSAMSIERNSDTRVAQRAARIAAAGSACALVALVLATQAIAGPREQAKRMYDRLTGTPPSPALLNDLESRVSSDPVDAALYMLDPASARSSDFYRVTLKNFVTPWTNREQTVFAPLNDYSATVIGMVRDDVPFDQVLSGDILYTADGASPAYSPANNDHYAALEEDNADLRTALTRHTQSSLNAVPATATAGIITSRAASEAFFVAGTNRAMFRFTLLNHLCRDLERVQDTSRPPDRIRQDVSRSPGGDSRIFLNNCIGCHSGMDPMAQAFAYYQFDPTSARLVFTDGQVQPKYLINADNFKYGYVTPDDHWNNRWREGPNAVLGWPSAGGSGSGAKSLGEELAGSDAFADCQVEKVFRNVCFRVPSDLADRNEVARIVGVFKNNGHSLKQVFAETAVYCMGQ
jgi:hypothetical protein